MILFLLTLMLFALFFTIVANGFRNRKYNDAAEWVRYAFTLIVILSVIIFLLNNIKIQTLWQN